MIRQTFAPSLRFLALAFEKYQLACPGKASLSLQLLIFTSFLKLDLLAFIATNSSL